MFIASPYLHGFLPRFEFSISDETLHPKSEHRKLSLEEKDEEILAF